VFVDRQTTVGMNGQADFTNLVAGYYKITEELTAAQVAAGWMNTTELPMIFCHTGEVNAEKWIGNRIVEREKTFELTFEGDGPDSSITFFARYWLLGEAGPETDLQLLDPDSDGVFSDSLMLANGTTITKVEWYATWNGHDVLLGETAGETIDKDITNYFKYNGGMGGYPVPPERDGLGGLWQ